MLSTRSAARAEPWSIRCSRGSAQNGDIFFQAREACNSYYDAIPGVVVEYMNKINEKIGTDYKPFNYYGAPMRKRSSSRWAPSVTVRKRPSTS